MAAKKKIEEPTVEAAAEAASEPTLVVLPADASVAVYRDNAGKALGGGISEGAANFGAITAAARALVDGPPEAA